MMRLTMAVVVVQLLLLQLYSAVYTATAATSIQLTVAENSSGCLNKLPVYNCKRPASWAQ